MRAIGRGLFSIIVLLSLGTAIVTTQGRPDIAWMRGGHASYIAQMLHSSDGSFFVSAASDRTIKIWRTSDALLLRTLIIPRGTLAMALSPDNSVLCAGGGSDDGLPLIRCWRVADGSELWSKPAGAIPNEAVGKLSFSPDGLRLASAVGNKLPIWDASDGTLLTDFSGHGPNGAVPTSFAGGLAYSPDGSFLAVNTAGDYPRMALLNPANGSLLWDSGYSSISVAYDVAFSSDSQLVASVNGIGARVFGAFDHVQRSFPGNYQTLNVGFAPDTSRLAAGGFGNLFLWNATTGAPIRVWAAHGNPGVGLTPMTFTADSTRLLSGLLDIKRWKASDGSFDALLTAQVGPVRLLAMSANDDVVATYTYSPNTDHVISLFRGSDGAFLRYIDVGAEALRGLALSPDGKHVAAADNTVLRMWNVTTGVLERSRADFGRGSFYRPLAFTPDGSAIATSGDDRFLNVQLWNPTTDALTYIVGGPATALQFLPDGRLAIARQVETGGNPSVVLIVTLAGHVDAQLFGLANIGALAVSPNGQIIAAGGIDGAFSPYHVARLWRVSDGVTLQTLVGHTSFLSGIGFSWDSQTVVTGAQDATVRVWRVSDGSQARLYDQETYTVNPSMTGVFSLASSSRSARFVYGRGDGTAVAAFNPEAKATIRTFTVPTIATGCKIVTAKIVLDRPAPPGGLTVALASDLAAATLPASLKFKSGTSTKSFKITTQAVPALQAATISATLEGQTQDRNLDLRPIGISAITLAPNPVVGGNPTGGSVTLECKARPGDIVVNLSSSLPSAAQPVATITIPNGTSVGTFSVTTFPVTATKKPKIKATTVAGAVTKSRTLAVTR